MPKGSAPVAISTLPALMDGGVGAQVLRTVLQVEHARNPAFGEPVTQRTW
jgi:hypothetical protein